MTIDRIRALDRLLGTPLCWGLGAIRPLLRRRPAQTPASRVLVVKFFGMGSIVLATPALRLLRTALPGARIDLLTFAAHRDLGERLPAIDGVLTVDPASLGSVLRTTTALLGRLRRARYDAVIDLEFFAKFSTALAAWTGAPRVAGFALPTRWRRMHLTEHVPITKDRHVVHAFHDLAARIAGSGAVGQPEPPRIERHDRAAVDAIVPRDARALVVVHTGAGIAFPERRWPPEEYATAIRRLARPDRRFVFTGTARERGDVARIIDAVDSGADCMNVAGRLTIPQLAALLERASLVISNDTGPAHLTSALGRPMVALYGPETPAFYGPLDAGARVLYAATACSPCMNIYDAKAFRCPFHARCMHEIRVDDVVNAAEALLA